MKEREAFASLFGIRYHPLNSFFSGFRHHLGIFGYLTTYHTF